MKKKINWLVYLGIATLVFTLAAFLFPIGPGLTRTLSGGTVEWFRGYDYVFGNNANHIISHGAFIAAFSLLIIAAVFELLAFVFSVPNPEGSHKFSGFMYIVSGICSIVTGVIFFLAPMIVVPSVQASAPNVTYALAYGFIIGGGASILGAVVAIINGVMAMMKKAK
jgi:hypothetical protein